MADNYVRTTDPDLDVDEADINNNAEPATRHDVVEGGALGAVGGAIVGALAGGPLGAVVGAVAGGAASAGGVALVDRHDHDYVRTVEGHDGILEGNDTVDARTNTFTDSAVVAPGTYTDTGVTNPAPAYGVDDTDFRNDFQTRYGLDGGAYEDYAPAYRYGHDLASDPRFRDSDWNVIETQARSDWELRNEGTWDRIKDSVRFAWDRARGRSGATVYDPNANNYNV